VQRITEEQSAKSMLARSNSRPFVRNAILAGLPLQDLLAVGEFLEPMVLKERAILQESRRPVEHIYFPENGIVSLRIVNRDSILETAMEGYRGAVGASHVLGSCIPMYQSIVMFPGNALRVSAENLRRLMAERPSLHRSLLQYVQTLAAHNAQMALCGVRHDLMERLACWLCLACDTSNSNVLPVTHEYLSMVLGLRRAGITNTLNDFEGEGLVRKMRGVLQVDDRKRLQQKACSCYGVIADEYASAESHLNAELEARTPA
jgi:CRP-like cAMP-binding protein